MVCCGVCVPRPQFFEWSATGRGDLRDRSHWFCGAKDKGTGMCEKFSITNGLAEQVAGLCGAAEGSGDNGLMEKLVKERADAKNASEVLIACTPEESHGHVEGVEKNTPKIDVHHRPFSRKNDMEHLPSWLYQEGIRSKPPPHKMALNNILSRSLRWVELSSCKEPLRSANSTPQKPFRSESLEKT